MNIEYGRLIKSAFSLSWRNKSLWVFGLFTGAGLNMNFGFPGMPNAEDADTLPFYAGDFGIPHELLYGILGAIVLLGLLAAFVGVSLYCIASPALIDGVNKLTRGGNYRFAGSLSVGGDFFFRFFGLALFAVATVVVLGGVFSLLGFLAFAVHIGLGIASLLILMILIIPAVFVGDTIFSLAARAMVVRDCSIGEAVEEGYLLLRSRLSDTFLFFLLNMGLMMALGMACFFLLLLVGLPLMLVGFMSGGGFLSIVIGLLVGLPFSIILGGWSGTFFHTLRTLFYFELVDPQPRPVSPLLAV